MQEGVEEQEEERREGEKEKWKKEKAKLSKKTPETPKAIRKKMPRLRVFYFSSFSFNIL